MVKTSRPARPAKVPEGALAAAAATGKRPADAGGAQPDPALAEERVSSSATNTQGKPPRPDDGTDDRAEAPAVPADGGAGDPRENSAEREDRGGGDGNPAVPAREELPIMPKPLVLNLARTADTAAAPAPEWPLDAPQGDPARIDESLGILLEGCPRLLAEVRAFRAANPDRAVTGVRIAARRDGFRRAGMAHSKGPADHPANRFSPAELELLLAEPMLTVELV